MMNIALPLRCLRNSSFSPISWRSSTRPSSLVSSSVIAVSMATFLPIACINGSARPTRLAHSIRSPPISRIGGSKLRTSNSITALAVCCIWSMASSIEGIRFLMSRRANGGVKGGGAAVERGDEGAAHRGQHLTGDVVGIVLELIDALAIDRRLLTPVEHALERDRALDHGLGVAVEQVEEPFFLRQESAKQSHHG